VALKRPNAMETALRGKKNIVQIAPERPTVLIGKRAIPLFSRRPPSDAGVNYAEIMRNEALAQVAAGADVIGVSVNAGVDQVAVLPRAVEAVQRAVEVPVCIETADPRALAAALASCQGKPLVDAINGQQERLGEILPLVAEHGAAIIAHCDDETGVPDDPYDRLEIARRIIEQAGTLGIPREDVIIDCVTQAIEAEAEAALITLETVRLVRAELDANLTLDISAISAELPGHATLHHAFLTAAITEGVNAPIVNVARDRQIILATDVILGREEATARYIRYFHYRRSGMRSMVDWELVE
jgi:5-methyltetrahydrofolate--homocysteine methyltransferase